MVMSFMSTFLSYIVKSPEYYNVPQNETASTLGELGFYSELVLFPCHLLLGSLMDIVGRKLPTTVGLFGCAMAIACIPYGHKVYPDLCLMR
jgi:MFS family permease